jgi:transcriptional regulator GlxA family with amidase domain
MKVAYLLYPGFSALDVLGAFRVLVAAPGTESVFVAAEAGPVLDSTGVYPVRATHGFDAVRETDVLLVPGSDCTCASDDHLVEWLRLGHATTSWTVAVGTGSLHLAAAGFLAGAEAATHWSAAERLLGYGVTYRDSGPVRAGKVLTAAGASAGIDLALTVLDLSHGPAVAQTVQLILEYDPHPPHDAGSPAKAPAEIGELVRASYSRSAGARSPSADRQRPRAR